MITIQCEYCGKEFEGIRRTRRFCSGHCAHLKRYIPKPPRGKFFSCSFCGENIWVQPCFFIRKKHFCNMDHQVLFLKKNAFFFHCTICNKKVFTQPTQIKYRNRKTCSKVCLSVYVRKMAEERRIKYGYTKHQLDRLARYSKEATSWREAVFRRDNYICQICKKRGGYLEADHIKPFAFFPELRYELSNGRTLCRPCHDKTKIGYKEMRKLYAPKT